MDKKLIMKKISELTYDENWYKDDKVLKRVQHLNSLLSSENKNKKEKNRDLISINGDVEICSKPKLKVTLPSGETFFYSSVGAAAQHLDLSTNIIFYYLKEKTLDKRGIRYEWLKDVDRSNRVELKIIYSDGSEKKFKSITEAAKKEKISTSTIYRYMNTGESDLKGRIYAS